MSELKPESASSPEPRYRSASSASSDSTHHQTVERGIPHGRGDAASVPYRAKAAAVPQVEREQALRGRRPCPLGEGRRDVLEVQAMKTEAAIAGRMQLRRQGEATGDIRHGRMKSGVETGDLRHAWSCDDHRLNGIQPEPVVQRRKFPQGVDLGKAFRIDYGGGDEARTGVHQPVAAGGEFGGLNAACAKRLQYPRQGLAMARGGR
jgi:hypothetical protein